MLEESKVGIAPINFDGIDSYWHQSLMQEDRDGIIFRTEEFT